jgi:hypothetical protein
MLHDQVGARLRKALRASDVSLPERQAWEPVETSGAGEGIRTLDPNLGKVVLYP